MWSRATNIVAALCTGILLLLTITGPDVFVSGQSVPLHADVEDGGSLNARQLEPLQCISTAEVFYRFFQDQFGLATEQLRPFHEFATAREFAEQHLDQSGRAWQQLSLNEFTEPGQSRSRPAILLGPDDHLAVATSVLTDDRNHTCVQILESEQTSRLISADRLLAAGFSEVWILSDDSTHTEFKVGETVASIDHLLIPLGLVNPASHVSAEFCITNSGTQPMTINNIQPTCSCTVVEQVGDIELQVGESHQFRMSVATAEHGSSVHHVDLSLTDERSDKSERVRITASGNVLDSIRAAPQYIDFGTVDGFRHQQIERRIQLTESVLDPADIISVSATGADLELSWEQLPTGESPSREFRVSAFLDPCGLGVGNLGGEIVIQTTSHRRPTIVVPWQSVIRGEFVASPTMPNLRRDDSGKPPSDEIRISSRAGDITEATVLFCPPWLSCDVRRHNGEVRLTLTSITSKPARQTGQLKLGLTSEVSSDELVIHCHLFDNQTKGSDSR